MFKPRQVTEPHWNAKTARQASQGRYANLGQDLPNDKVYPSRSASVLRMCWPDKGGENPRQPREPNQ